MPPRTAWTHLLPGLITLAVVVSIAMGVLLFAGVDRAHGKTMHLYVVTNQAQGVMGGTEVWLVGQKVGTVKRIEFRPPEADSTRRLVLVLEVQERDAGQIRRDSRLQIRTGGTVIGPVVVYLTAGTPSGAAIADGDTLVAEAQTEVVATGGRLITAMSTELKPLMADARTVMALARGRRKSVQGTFTEEHDGEVVELRNYVSRVRGIFALPTAARDTRAQASLALARVDSIRALLNSPATSLGRFRRDTAFRTTVGGVRAELGRVRTLMESENGNFGRLAHDSAMTRSLADAQRELTLLMDDMRRRPQRYIAF